MTILQLSSYVSWIKTESNVKRISGSTRLILNNWHRTICFWVRPILANLSSDVFNERDLTANKRWWTAHSISNHFWWRWMREYVPCLTVQTTFITLPARHSASLCFMVQNQHYFDSNFYIVKLSNRSDFRWSFQSRLLKKEVRDAGSYFNPFVFNYNKGSMTFNDIFYIATIWIQ